MAFAFAVASPARHCTIRPLKTVVVPGASMGKIHFGRDPCTYRMRLAWRKTWRNGRKKSIFAWSLLLLSPQYELIPRDFNITLWRTKHAFATPTSRRTILVHASRHHP